MPPLALAAALLMGPGGASGQTGTTPPLPAREPSAVQLPPTPPGTSLQRPAATPPAAESCTACHAQVAQGPVVHGALQMDECSACHRAAPGQAGKCKSRTASKWALVRSEPELCYGCHDRWDRSKSVHTIVRQGSCLACHDAHSSKFKGLVSRPRQELCLDCHDLAPLLSKPVKHAPVAEGRCLDCHDPHGGDRPNNLRAEGGNASCLKCHDAKAPTGAGTPGPAYRIDLAKKVVHDALQLTDCLGCHDGGHGSANPKLLKKAPVDLCYGCHDRQDKNTYPHGAVLLGDCVACHDPHASDVPKLLTRPTLSETCFVCHQDDLTGRKFVHAPAAKGCDECHAPHGAQARNGLKLGDGKAACYRCHKPVDGGKVKHAALERYGCTGCHDPHGAGNRGLLGKSVNDLCGACHEGQRDGRHVTPLLPRGHVVGGANLRDPKRPGHDFTCASCHDPHGSDTVKLLYVGPTAIDSCAWCHGDKSGQRPELHNVISSAGRRPVEPGAAGSEAPAAGGASR